MISLQNIVYIEFEVCSSADCFLLLTFCGKCYKLCLINRVSRGYHGSCCLMQRSYHSCIICNPWTICLSSWQNNCDCTMCNIKAYYWVTLILHSTIILNSCSSLSMSGLHNILLFCIILFPLFPQCVRLATGALVVPVNASVEKTRWAVTL